MADVLNRATRQFLRSVNEPDFPLVEWIHNPDLSNVIGYATKYWVITGDTVTLMDEAARNTVDAAELVARRDREIDELNDLEAVLRAVLLIIMDEFNAHAEKINAMLSAMDASTSLADMKNRIGNIPDYPARTPAQLISAIRNKLGS